MAQNNMRKMFTEQQIIDLVKQHQDEQRKNQPYHLMVVGEFADGGDVVYLINPKLTQKSSTGEYYLTLINIDGGTIETGKWDINDNSITINNTPVLISSADINLIDIISGEIIAEYMY